MATRKGSVMRVKVSAKTMSANRRFTASVLLAVSLAIGTAVTAAGCGGSSPAAAPATTSAAPPASAAPSPSISPKISAAALQNIINCMKSHGVNFSTARLTGKDVKNVFRSLTPARQQSVFNACGQVLPAEVRQVVQQRIAQETAGATASP
jgi:hypothetical protein